MTDAPRPPKPVNPPVERASTLLFERAQDVYRTDLRGYGRAGMQVHDALKDAFMELEGGAACVLAPSGLSAVASAILALCEAGQHVLFSDGVYGPTRRLALKTLPRFGMSATFYAPRVGSDIASAIRPETGAIVMEAPSSLTFELHDVPAIAAAARARGVPTLIDDTWGAGLAYKPLALGADVAIHAATKFPSGGSDVLMGALVAREPSVGERLQAYATETGLAVSADDAYLVLRGMRSLPTRFERQQDSALALAHWLAARPEVADVRHPALPTHPDHAIWRRDYRGGGALFAVELAPDWTHARVDAFLNALSVFGLGFSYGGFESLAISCHAQLRRSFDDAPHGPLVRLAVGLEPLDTLTADLDSAFAAAT